MRRKVLVALAVGLLILVFLVGVVLVRGVLRPQNPKIGEAGEYSSVRIEDNDSRVKYEGGKWRVGKKQLDFGYDPSGGTYHLWPWDNLDKEPSRVTVKFQGAGIRVVGLGAGNRGKLKVVIDGGTAEEFDQYTPGVSAKTIKPEIWIDSKTLPCGEHAIVLETLQERNPKSTGNILVLDYFEVKACGEDKGSNEAGSANLDGSEVLCQGDSQGRAKCFDCYRDSDSVSEVNIVDFSCFSKYYGKSVGF